MRRALILTLLVLAWTIGPVARVQDGPVTPAPEPTNTLTTSR
ncbi:hypothetical protein [Streptomyces sp. NPDC088794]